MSTIARFLTVVDAYPGYCQICHEPRVVGRIQQRRKLLAADLFPHHAARAETVRAGEFT